MTDTPADRHIWGPPDRPLDLVARNVSTRYVAIFVDGAIGLVLLPFNVSHLGPAAYGLWALTTSVTWFFGVLDLGYGSALVKFIAQYRAWRDRAALNEIISTISLVFAGLGAFCFLVTAVLAWRIDSLFRLEPGQVRTAQQVLLIVGAYLSVRFPLAIFGAVVYGFQRYYLNNVASIGISLVVAAVNVAVLGTGHGLVALVAAVTAVRVLSLGLFAWNGYRAFPGLHVRPSLFRRERLKELTGFSVYMLVLDWSAKLNYSSDTIVIGAMMDTTAVALWTVGQRLAQLAQQLAGQLNDALFPNVVDSDAAQRHDRLQMILVHGNEAVAGPCRPYVPRAHRRCRYPPPQLGRPEVRRECSAHADHADGRAGAGQYGVGQSDPERCRSTPAPDVHERGNSRGQRVIEHRPGPAVGTARRRARHADPGQRFDVVRALSRPPAGEWGCLSPARLIEAIWPAMWPAVIMIGLLSLAKNLPPSGLPGVVLHLAVGGLVYIVLFLGVAIGSAERRFYWSKIRDLVASQRRSPAVA